MYHYRTFDDMAKCIRKNISKIPFDFDRIVGIPRSGIIPAYMIALFLNKKACSLDELLQNTQLSSGYSREVDGTDCIKKILIVDDSVHSGIAIGHTKEKIQAAAHLKNIEIKYLAIFAREQAISFVDYYFEIVPVPRIFQWNYLNINVNERSCFDIDGVLCVDPTPEENDDGEKYRNFILNARPLYIPKYKIKALVTSRLEKYRALTEEWLCKNNVQYEKLFMLDLPNKEARIAMGAHGKFKAKIFAQSDAQLFVESEPKQAEEIARLSGKPCICVGNDRYYEGDGVCKVDVFNLEEYKRKDHRKRILLFSHEFTYTGAPHSLLRICKVLNPNYYVEVWGPASGEFEKEFENLGVKVCIVPYEICRIENVKKAIKSFDFCIVNTVISNRFYDVASQLIPTAWYIREATNIPDICRGNKNREFSLRRSRDLYCVSEYARDFIAQNYNRRVKVIRNCMEDYADRAKKKTDHSVVNFLQIGTITLRKGFVEYVNAFRSLPKELQSRAHLYFAGRLIPGRSNYWQPLLDSITGDENITYLGEIKGQEEKIRLFNNIDVFVVASYDESCSLVVLEGAMLSKPLIVTENVGAKYMVDGNGFIVKTKDINSLAEAMRYFIQNSDQIDAMGEISRKAYETMASMEIYDKNISSLAKEYLAKSKVCWRIRRALGRKISGGLVYKFLCSIKQNGIKATWKKTVAYLARSRRQGGKRKGNVPVALWGTSATKTALNGSAYARVGTWVGKTSVRSLTQPAFEGEIDISISNNDTQNILSDIRKNTTERLLSGGARYIAVDLLDEKFDLVRFNGQYVISNSDSLKRNLDKIRVEKIEFSHKQLLRFNCTPEQTEQAVRLFAQRLKEKYAQDKIILHEAYFATTYRAKDGTIKRFAENKVKSFEEKNRLLVNMYARIKAELPGCRMIAASKYRIADENHPQGLSTMHFIPEYYRSVTKQIDKIIKAGQ